MTVNPLDNAPESASRWPWQAVVGVPVVLAVLILWGSPNFTLQSGPEAEPFGGDFIQEWTGGWMLRHGDRSRFYDPAYISEVEHDVSLIGFEWDADGYLPMVYPPFWYLLVSPMSLLPMTTGAVVWTLLMTAALAGALWLLSRTPLDRRRASPFVLAALLVYAPLIESLGSGQKGTLLLLLFAATFVLLDRRQLYWAGVVFGLVAFKPQLTLVVALAMLCKRQWAFIAGGVTTGVLLVGLSFATGSEMCRQFFELCAGMGDYVQTEGYALHKAHCWWGACQLMLGRRPGRRRQSVCSPRLAADDRTAERDLARPRQVRFGRLCPSVRRDDGRDAAAQSASADVRPHAAAVAALAADVRQGGRRAAMAVAADRAVRNGRSVGCCRRSDRRATERAVDGRPAGNDRSRSSVGRRGLIAAGPNRVDGFVTTGVTQQEMLPSRSVDLFGGDEVGPGFAAADESMRVAVD